MNIAQQHAHMFALTAIDKAEQTLQRLRQQAEGQQDSILVPLKNIPVTEANENDWQFVAIQDANGYHVAVF